jgi:hypothetical protein
LCEAFPIGVLVLAEASLHFMRILTIVVFIVVECHDLTRPPLTTPML